MQLQQRTQNKWFLSQQSKQKRKKIKIGIFTAMFRFPNHSLKLKAPNQLQSAGKKVFWHVILHSYLSCTTLCLSFHQNRKQLIFFQNILKSKASDESNQARKKLFCHVLVKNYLRNVSWKFLIKIESTWKSKSRHPSWLNCTMVGLSEAATGGVV